MSQNALRVFSKNAKCNGPARCAARRKRCTDQVTSERINHASGIAYNQKVLAV